MLRRHGTRRSPWGGRLICLCGNDLPCLTDPGDFQAAAQIESAADAAALLALIGASSVVSPTAPFPTIIEAAQAQLAGIQTLLNAHTRGPGGYCAAPGCLRQWPCPVWIAASRAETHQRDRVALAAPFLSFTPGRHVPGEEPPLSQSM